MARVQEQPRTRIVRAAVSVFARDGYRYGSLNDVAVAAGLSRQNLLYYYPSKQELLLAVLEERDAELDRALHSADPERYATMADYVSDVSALLPKVYADRELVALYHRLVAEAADPLHPAREWVRDRHERIRDAYESMIRRAITAGELRDDIDARALATALLGAVEGIESQWLVNDDVDWAAATRVLRAFLAACST